MYRIVMEVDRGAGMTGAHRYAFRNAEPTPTIDEEGWFVFDRAQLLNATIPIGMPDTGTVRFNPTRVVWWASCATESPDDRPSVA